MMPHAPRTRLLVALFDLAQASEIIDLYSLAEEAGLNLYRTLSEIHALSLVGMVDARRLRLTAAGLAVAAALSAQLGRSNVHTVNASNRSRSGVAGARRPPQIARHKEQGSYPSRQQTQGTVCDFFERDLVA